MIVIVILVDLWIVFDIVGWFVEGIEIWILD